MKAIEERKRPAAMTKWHQRIQRGTAQCRQRPPKHDTTRVGSSFRTKQEQVRATYIRLSRYGEVLIAIVVNADSHTSKLIVDIALLGESRHRTDKVPCLVEDGALLEMVEVLGGVPRGWQCLGGSHGHGCAGFDGRVDSTQVKWMMNTTRRSYPVTFRNAMNVGLFPSSSCACSKE
jgi:hypothetical protein